jgi:DNA-binding response OmpR family regulator
VGAGDRAAGLERDKEEEGADAAATVLVVEDNAEMRAYLHEELSRGWNVIIAADGEAGWERVQADEPDLVVSDVMMPGLSGTDLCRKIKADEALRATPVLLLTARAGEEATVEGLEAGADDYVSKPFGSNELRVRIENHLAARRHLEARYRQEVAVEALGAVVEVDEQPFVERVLTAAGEQLSNPDFGVGALAEEMALSRRQLTRRLKRAVGEPPGQVLRQLRIERGKVLLRNGAETVSEVAYATGFRSPSAFSHAFGEMVGQTPTEYVEAQDG